MSDRLQKILARAGIASRRRAEEIILQGRVSVNGRIAEIGQSADPERDAIKVDGKLLVPRCTHRYLLLNKPKGYLTTSSDPQGRPTVLDLVPAGLRKALVPVGRLDFETEGLLLLTDDGELAQRIAHPRYGCSKTYEVKVRGIPSAEAIRRLRSGLVIDGKKTAPAKVSALKRKSTRRGATNSSWWRVEIGEGRNRQIREMFFRIDHPVQKLRRIAIGGVSDRTLGRGELRELTERELKLLRRRLFTDGPDGSDVPDVDVSPKETA